ncbi:PepSY domain-containing protein [Aliidiomarina indica]|uniref:PepSY domain-containing protein n=1 Tax=Aliidiomarina indica TaxID=2749147 RepID=UPI00188F7CE0|nr:PepSY domain-containing protein [Aliidiomarina indica]
MQFKALKARKVHRWLTLLFGAQLIIWSITGTVMVLLQLPYIHGHHLSQPADRPITQFELLERIPELAAHYPDALEAGLVSRYLHGEYHYRFRVKTEHERFLVHPNDFSRIALTEDDIVALAERLYAGSDSPSISRLTLLNTASELPREVASRHAPVWQVEFADTRRTTFYLARDTGDLVTQRHQAWRFFDIMWMLHIMDYQDRSNISTWWILAFASMTFVIALTGLWLLMQRYIVRGWRRLWRE